jgi:aldehyde dehydrogenase (NAD+)
MQRRDGAASPYRAGGEAMRLADRTDIYIDGSFTAAHSASRIDLVNPATEQVIGTVPASDAVDVDAAVTAARRALPSWRSSRPEERAVLLEAVAEAYEKRAEEIGSLITVENASPRWWTVQENVVLASHIYRRGAELARSLENESVNEVNGNRALACREAIGVVGAIVPWNSPQVLLALKVSAALAAGCTVVAKPSPETSLDAYLLAEVFDSAGLPDGVMNIVTGAAETGEAIVRHDGVDKISFTGSTMAGRAIASICGSKLREVTAELGGKSAALLLEDADLDVFTSLITTECIPYSGQVCFSCTRILVARSRYDDVLERVVETLRSTPFGDPADPSTVIGPLVTARQRDRVEDLVQSGIAAGAQLALGSGSRPKDYPVGYYVEPTVFTDVEPSMRIFQEEIFGPVLVVVPYDDEDEAIRLHNDTGYGLSGMVFSRDIERATKVARQLETGQVLVNGHRGPPTPHAPYKNSGMGQGGVDRLSDYLRFKSISQP